MSASSRRSSEQVLGISGLSVSFLARREETKVLRGVDLSLGAGEIVSLVGESGSGKSTLIGAVLGTLPDSARVTGSLAIGGRGLETLTSRERSRLLTASVGFIPQDPVTALSPVTRIDRQIQRYVGHLRRASALPEEGFDAERTLRSVGIPDPARVLRSSPGQLSGGLLQRVLIGIALITRPRLLVADEPTSGLDVSTQKIILDLIQQLRDEHALSVLLITHDLSLAVERSDRIAVLNAGVVVEDRPPQQIVAAPSNAYTRQLLSDSPYLNPDRFGKTTTLGGGAAAGGEAVLAVRDLSRAFASERGEGARHAALVGVSLEVHAGQTLGVVGESGSGKTTLARIVCGLETADAGEVVYGGRRSSQIGELYRTVQLVYQNPYASLDPRFRVSRIVQEPVRNFRLARSAAEARSLVLSSLRDVGIPDELVSRPIGHLSGGQRQRVAIARALVVRPPLLVLDEPTSALDVSVQGQILGLLHELQQKYGIAYVFISHDLGVVRQVADRIAVFRNGVVVEQGSNAQVFTEPASEYTRTLIQSIPGPAARGEEAVVGERLAAGAA